MLMSISFAKLLFFFIFASLLLKKYTILCNTEQELHKIAINDYTNKESCKIVLLRQHYFVTL